MTDPARAVRRLLGATALAAATAVALALVPPGSAPGGWLKGAAPILGFTLLKVLLLSGAARWSSATRARLGPGHAARRPWGLLAGGCAGYAAGHVALGIEQLAFESPPFPFVSDAFFLPAALALAAAQFGFLAAYLSSGFFPDRGARRAAAIAVTLAAGVAAVVVVTTVRLPVPWPERATDVAYAVLDLALLVPLVLLVRLARRLGGPVGHVWRLLLGGFMVLAVADVSIGYLDALGIGPSYLLSQAPFLVAYGLVAAGSRRQLALLET
jgi:hypothetical protein